MWQVFLMYALFGSIFSVGKMGIAASQPYFLTGVRMFLAGGLMLGYLYLRSPKSLAIEKSDWLLLFLIAFFNVFITNAFEFWGLQYMSAGKTCLIYSLSPFAAALIAYFFGTDKMTWKKWMGLLIGFLSFCPMMSEPWLKSVSNETDSMELFSRRSAHDFCNYGRHWLDFCEKANRGKKDSPRFGQWRQFCVGGRHVSAHFSFDRNMGSSPCVQLARFLSQPLLYCHHSQYHLL